MKPLSAEVAAWTWWMQALQPDLWEDVIHRKGLHDRACVLMLRQRRSDLHIHIE